MFKKTRRRIVLTIMLILTFVWVLFLMLIFISSYFDMFSRNTNMLKMHSSFYILNQENLDQDDEFPDKNGDFPMFQLTTFYTVAFSYDGKVLEVRNEQEALHSNEELINLAYKVLDKEHFVGLKSNLVYYKTDKDGYILITFMDNVFINRSTITLFRYTMIFGGIALAVFLVLSIFMSKKIVKPLEENYQKQKQFISDAGHELKTPVSIVNANSELLYREIGDNQWLTNIQYENERMGALVTQLLELAKTENVVLEKEKIDFSNLCNGEVLPFESIIYENNITLNLDISDNLFLLGNAVQLKQLIAILMENAIRYNKENGEIIFTLTKEHKNVKLSVINKGDEISKEQKKLIFERFYRVDTSRNSEEKHYGLGLAIAKSIVNNHNGKIEVLTYNGYVEFIILIPCV